ncbi:MAG: hypothetical protein ABH891_05355 [Candidatus Omnitrophota bacterium]
MNKRPSRSISWKRCLAVPVLLVLMVYHFLLAMYLSLVKQIRKSLLFPGG